MKVCVVTLFPEFFDGPMQVSIPARAIERGELRFDTVQIRDFGKGVHRSVDDTPYGGGAGMVMRAVELGRATAAAKERLPNAPVVLMSPQGARLTQGLAAQLAELDELILVCGRYEGVDERFVERHVDAELSIGDVVLSGGEAAAFCVIDAVTRLLPGVLGNADSAREESFVTPRLEHPQFTRPPVYDGLSVPPVLVSGDHARIDRWRRKAALLRTLQRRPDLLPEGAMSDDDLDLLADDRDPVDGWLQKPRKLESSS